MVDSALPRAQAALEQGVKDGWHYGAQLSVIYGRRQINICVGDAAPGMPMTPEHVLCWSSTVKPVMSVALARLYELGCLDFNDPVAKHIPGFAARGKDRATIAHCLTHQVGLWGRGLGGKPTENSPERVVAHICRMPPMEGWEEPGVRCGYDSPAWFVLGAVVTAADPKARPYNQFVQEEIFEPLGLGSCSVGMTEQRYESLLATGLLVPIYVAPLDKPRNWKPIPIGEEADNVQYPDPSGNGRGPAAELARLYGALLPRHTGAASGNVVAGEEAETKTTLDAAPQLLHDSTVELITKTAREGVYDELQGVDTAWSLGFALRSLLSGRHASTKSFGHGGSQSSWAFADPEYGLAVACVCNGKPGPDFHYRRVGAVSTAVYEDLGLVTEERSWRKFKLPGGLGTF